MAEPDQIVDHRHRRVAIGDAEARHPVKVGHVAVDGHRRQAEIEEPRGQRRPRVEQDQPVGVAGPEQAFVVRLADRVVAEVPEDHAIAGADQHVLDGVEDHVPEGIAEAGDEAEHHPARATR